MHPPWINYNFILLLFAIATNPVLGEETNGGDNATASRPQRDTNERERRLIPYMTYYITQSLTSRNAAGTRQNIFLPVTSPRENIFQLATAPKISLTNIQNVNPQGIEILPKQVLRLPSPSFTTPTIQADQYKEREGGAFPQLYRLESGIVQRPIHAPAQPELQSPSQPLQIIKVPVEQKYTGPQVVKIIPYITKVAIENKPPKSFIPLQPQLVYTRPKVHTLTFEPQTSNGQNYYKEPLQNEYSYQENKLYASHIPRGSPQLRIIEPAPNKYTITKIVMSTTTATPYINDVRAPKEGTDHIPVGHVNPAPVEYTRQPENYVSIVPGQQVYIVQKQKTEQSQDLIQSQNDERVPRLRVPEEEKIRFVASVTPATVTNHLEQHDERQREKPPLNNIFSLLKETNKLPQNLTPDNIDTGIKTLALILEQLQQQKKYQQSQKTPITGSSTAEPPTVTAKPFHQNSPKVHSFPEKSGTSTPGRPGLDYPIYSSIPQTNFDCSTQRYKGFFGDPDTKCQVWHYCDLNGGQASFLCPNGTIFSQVALTCDWWFNVKCASTSQLYVLNERLYKYILPFSPSFPEDYSGPVVDTYLEAKFKEMEAKSKSKALKSVSNSTTTAKPEITTEAVTGLPTEPVEYRTESSEE